MDSKRPNRERERADSDRQPWHAWYGLARWKRLRLRQLSQHPLCAFCLAAGVIEPATICDHVEPHRGDEKMFWAGPFQSLCKPHHDATKRRAETKGYLPDVDVNGWPVDPLHPANRDDARRLARLDRQGTGGTS
jgi:5-methylcytosine-specific restriction protein A